jgi:hypothetical protein
MRGHDDDFERCWREDSEQLGQCVAEATPKVPLISDRGVNMGLPCESWMRQPV